jgi:hypothetical protein
MFTNRQRQGMETRIRDEGDKELEFVIKSWKRLTIIQRYKIAFLLWRYIVHRKRPLRDV